jgi:hypothetical protein
MNCYKDNLSDKIRKLLLTQLQQSHKLNDIIDSPLPLSQNNIINNASTTKNKGTGAGGLKTNYYGKQFEDKTNNYFRLLEMGYIRQDLTSKNKYDYYLSKIFENNTTVFVSQQGLKTYMKYKYKIDIFRCPDEAYIIEYNNGDKVIKILEKKEQRFEGSVETKLWSGPSLKREYELILGKEFTVVYGFCVSDFLKTKLISNKKKYTVLNDIFIENNIDVLFGDDENYFETCDDWLVS